MVELRKPDLKTYRKKMNLFWWTERPSYLRFILRELTSVPVAIFAVTMLIIIDSVSSGKEAYSSLLLTFQKPWAIVLSVVIIGGLLFHSITWFNLAPKAIVIKLGKFRVPGFVIALSNYVGWAIISVTIAWFLLN